MELWFSECHAPDVKHSLRVNRHLYSGRSEYQQIDIFDTPEFGRVLALDGNVMLTERDEFIYDEMITHIPMSVHKNVKDILVIGAGDGGVVRELTRYDTVERIDLVQPEGRFEARPLRDLAARLEPAVLLAELLHDGGLGAVAPVAVVARHDAAHAAGAEVRARRAGLVDAQP